LRENLDAVYVRASGSIQLHSGDQTKGFSAINETLNLSMSSLLINFSGKLYDNPILFILIKVNNKYRYMGLFECSESR
jgi:hypothetical protein